VVLLEDEEDEEGSSVVGSVEVVLVFVSLSAVASVEVVAVEVSAGFSSISISAFLDDLLGLAWSATCFDNMGMAAASTLNRSPGFNRTFGLLT